MKRTAYLLLGVVVIALAWIWFSPYSKPESNQKREIAINIEIAASPAQVFSYLGNSSNASKWSSYVDHITALNPTEAPDGTLGSLRRCFRETNESAARWDETIIAVDSAQLRRLTIFNLHGFPISSTHLLTEQRYVHLASGACKLTFALYLDEQADSLDALKLYIASYKIAAIFKANLLQIKLLNETKAQ